jgi:hypothetical protein
MSEAMEPDFILDLGNRGEVGRGSLFEDAEGASVETVSTESASVEIVSADGASVETVEIGDIAGEEGMVPYLAR